MLLLSLCLWCVCTDVISAETYKCKKSYQPSSYKNNTQVPTNCHPETPWDCPRSWKSGVPKGSTTTEPLIYENFLICHERSATCGYVPTKCAANEQPLTVTMSDAKSISDQLIQNVTSETEKRYNEDKESNAKKFADLPRGIRTAIISVWYQLGKPEAYTEFWKAVTENQWESAIHELRHFYADASKQQQGDLRRRNNEADIIAATTIQCHRSLDAVILVDESRSVSTESFHDSLNFVKKLIKAFPEDKLKGENGTRFGLSTFHESYTSHFHLSTYKSQSNYLAAIDRVNRDLGGTSLGSALIQTLSDQFNEAHGLRGYLPKVLIVLTDGESQDQVSGPAEHLRQNDIVIYAIGIGNYDIYQLRELASPLFADSRIFTLANYGELDSLIATITATTCNEPQPVPLDKQLTAVTKKDEYQYFLFIIEKSSNLEVTLNDLAGATLVYLSRSNPHPYKYDSDIDFGTASQKLKVIVIAPVEGNSERTKRDTSGEQPIYVAVQGTTELASFTIEAKTCHPQNCTEGTNEEEPGQPSRSKSSVAFSCNFWFLCLVCLLKYLVDLFLEVEG